VHRSVGGLICSFVDGSIIEGLSLYCGTGSRRAAGTTHGILARARCSIINAYVTGFAGSGIAIFRDNGNTPMWRNASGFHIRGGRTPNNGVHGLHIQGSDANAGEVVGLDTFGNGQFGKLDKSFLGNTFIGEQDAGNGFGTYVDFPAAGQSYSAALGHETAAKTTQPGTNPAVWIALPDVSGGGFPTSFTPILKGVRDSPNSRAAPSSLAAFSALRARIGWASLGSMPISAICGRREPSACRA